MDFLHVKEIKKVFISEKQEAVTALENLSFECQEGEFLCIVGSTGCGKTTLLRLIAGLETPNAGSISMNGRRVDGINRDATLVFQQYSLFPWRTVIDNICFGPENLKTEKKERYERARELISLFGMSGFEKAYPYELSGGMQQRVALARALAYDSKLLLLDEPFAALDERTRHRLQEEILNIWRRRKKTVILVTHTIDEAVFCASRVLVMRDRPGMIEEEIPIEISRPRDRRLPEFVNYHLRIREVLEKILTQHSNS